MLDRWNAEDVSKEPDWSVADLEPVTLRHGTKARSPVREAGAGYGRAIAFTLARRRDPHLRLHVHAERVPGLAAIEQLDASREIVVRSAPAQREPCFEL
jgi:hypothetical protein